VLIIIISAFPSWDTQTQIKRTFANAFSRRKYSNILFVTSKHDKAMLQKEKEKTLKYTYTRLA